jgi:hypothetical protein
MIATYTDPRDAARSGVILLLLGLRLTPLSSFACDVYVPYGALAHISITRQCGHAK